MIDAYIMIMNLNKCVMGSISCCPIMHPYNNVSVEDMHVCNNKHHVHEWIHKVPLQICMLVDVWVCVWIWTFFVLSSNVYHVLTNIYVSCFVDLDSNDVCNESTYTYKCFNRGRASHCISVLQYDFNECSIKLFFWITKPNWH